MWTSAGRTHEPEESTEESSEAVCTLTSAPPQLPSRGTRVALLQAPLPVPSKLLAVQSRSQAHTGFCDFKRQRLQILFQSGSKMGLEWGWLSGWGPSRGDFHCLLSFYIFATHQSPFTSTYYQHTGSTGLERGGRLVRMYTFIFIRRDFNMILKRIISSYFMCTHIYVYV